MDARELRVIRRDLDMTQGEMARGLGLSIRAYQDLESEDRDILERHEMLVERLTMKEAVRRRDPMLMPIRLRREVALLAREQGLVVA